MGGFATNISGNYGDEKVAQSTRIGGLALGTRMMLPDGRIFVHSRAGATALVAGKLYQGKAGETNTIFISTLATATGVVGDKTITVTVSGTVLAEDTYADGYITLHTGTGIGSVYKVKSHPEADASTCVVALEPSDGLVTAVAGGTTTAGMRKNEFDSVLLTTADTVGVNFIAGVAPAVADANDYCWIQRRGACLCLEDNSTAIVGLPVTASTVTAGAIGLFAPPIAHMSGIKASSPIAGSRDELVPVGECMSVGGSGGYALIYLKLD